MKIFKKSKEKRKAEKKQKLTATELNIRTRKQILMIIAAGMILIAADCYMTSSQTLKVIRSYGQLYIIRPMGQDNGYLTLKASINDDGTAYEQKINLTLEPYKSRQSSEKSKEETDDSVKMSKEELYAYELRSMADQINSDVSVKRVRLPESLESGENISWEIEDSSRTNTFAIVFLTVFITVIVYKNRLLPLEKEKKKNRESVIRQLPEFVNRLVLLLNAGLVISSAFEKSVEESLVFRNDEDDYFNMKMKEIYLSVKTANGSMHRELKSFAKETGIKELMRVSNIISDNISKGVELADKLQNESEILWINRKKNCEEQSRLAETKLTLPLVIFLMVLIVITVAPALLEL